MPDIPYLAARCRLALLVLLTMPAMVQAQFNYVINNGAITITGYTGPGGAVTIPSTISSMPVTSIGQNAFYYCSILTNLTIPNSVTNLGMYAFYGCTNLTNVAIGSGVTTIEEHAFGAFQHLTRLTIGSNVTSIGGAAFVDCFRLADLTIPNSVTSMNSAFPLCRGLTNVTIGNNVASMNGAFSQCSSLTTITVPNSVTNMRDAFSLCTSLTNVTLGNRVASLDNAFYGCSSLTSIVIPNSVTNVSYAFSYCSSLTSVTIPDSVTSIGDRAFYACSSLTNVTIPNSIASIGGQAFFSCANLSNVTIPGSVTNIADWAFAVCPNLTRVYFPGTAPSLGSYVFYDDSNATIYYVPCTAGWSSEFGDRPLVPTGEDHLPPTITCPTDLVMTNAGGVGGMVVSFTPTASDECAVTNVECVPASGSTFPQGTNTVTCTAWDNAGNTNACAFTVEVKQGQRISGRLALEGYVGPGRDGRGLRPVTFTATDDATNVLMSWTVTLEFAPDAHGYGVASFTVTNPPAGTTHLSAKTAWQLRKRLAMSFPSGEASADFTGDNMLPAGDLDGSGTVDLDDYFILAAAWDQADAAADIDGSGRIDLDDYFLLANRWSEQDDAP